jgi:hypothetical protein
MHMIFIFFSYKISRKNNKILSWNEMFWAFSIRNLFLKISKLSKKISF